MATEDQTTDDGRGERRQDTNVVPFPGDWIGPREELVPVGPESAGSVERAEVAAPFAPEAFWSEHSDAIHDVLKAPAPEAALPAGRRSSARLRPVALFASAVGVAALAVAFVPALVSSLAGGSRPHPLAAARAQNRKSSATAGGAGLLAVTRSPRPVAGAKPVVPRAPRLAVVRGRVRRAHAHRRHTVTSGIFVSDRTPASSVGGGQTGSASPPPVSSGGSQAGTGGGNAAGGGGSQPPPGSGPVGQGAPFGPGQLG